MNAIFQSYANKKVHFILATPYCSESTFYHTDFLKEFVSFQRSKVIQRA